MAMKRIVVCCDGTWNDTDSIDDLTNVSRLAWATKSLDDRGNIAQIVYYQSGVGSEGDIVSQIKGGSLGLGLARNVRDAYTFICGNYRPGDDILLFGFSRGAYTARSVAGLIGYAGVIAKEDLDRFMIDLWEGYKTQSKDALEKFPSRLKDVKIKCVGVWDTVGSLGIPGNLGSLFKKDYDFHDTKLGPRVERALHALALDEQRKDFAPTLWEQTADGRAGGQVLKQVWFAGVHSDIGGGYPEHGLSDITLAWMASEVEDILAIDFDYLLSRRDRGRKWSLGELHNSADNVFWQERGLVPRKPFGAKQETSCESIHPSVAARLAGGTDAAPGAYPLLDELKAKISGTLSDREKKLRWDEVQKREAKPAESRLASTVGSIFNSPAKFVLGKLGVK